MNENLQSHGTVDVGGGEAEVPGQRPGYRVGLGRTGELAKQFRTEQRDALSGGHGARLREPGGAEVGVDG